MEPKRNRNRNDVSGTPQPTLMFSRIMPSQQRLQPLPPPRQTQQAKQYHQYLYQQLQQPLEEGECLCKGAWEKIRPDNQPINNYSMVPPFNMTEYITKYGEGTAPTEIDIYICTMPDWNPQNRPEALFLPWEKLKAIEFSYLQGDIIGMFGLGIVIFFHIRGSMANFMAPFMAKYATRRYCYWADHFTLGLNQNAFRRSNAGLKIQLSGEETNGWLKATITHEDQLPEGCKRIQQAQTSGQNWVYFNHVSDKFQADDDSIPPPGDLNSIRAQIQLSEKFSTSLNEAYAYVRFVRLPMSYGSFGPAFPTRFVPWADVDGVEFSYRYPDCVLFWGADLELYLHIPGKMARFFAERRFPAIEWTNDFSLEMKPEFNYHFFGLKFQLISPNAAVTDWQEVMVSHEKIPGGPE